jgi:hypothetical protein
MSVFYQEKAKTYTVRTNRETAITVVGQIDMDVSLSSENMRVSPGETVTVQPKLLADRSLYLSSCTIGKDAESRRAEGNAEIMLLAPDGKVASRGVTGFSRGGFCSHSYRVPSDASGMYLIAITFDMGPLAAKVTGVKQLEVGK